MVTAGEKYRHYKGGEYLVLNIAKHSDTEEDIVVYQDVHAPEKVWVRALPIFEETVEWEGSTVPRFAKI